MTLTVNVIATLLMAPARLFPLLLVDDREWADVLCLWAASLCS